MRQAGVAATSIVPEQEIQSADKAQGDRDVTLEREIHRPAARATLLPRALNMQTAC